MKKKVLVVDDDTMICDLVKTILETEGYDVTQASNGIDGLKVFEANQKIAPFALVVLDVMMPGMSGLDVLTRIKIHETNKSTPVIMLTGESKPEDHLAGYQQGADYYITKPFTRQQLLHGLKLIFSPE